MGQAISRTKPRRSHQPANASHHALHQGISRPEPPRRLTHISELIDIDQLIRQRSSTTDLPPDDSPFTEDPTTTDVGAAPPVMIQSPSGHILSSQQYLERPDRVMTLEERKNSIRSNTERRIRFHESREGLRAEATRTPRALLRGRKSSADDKGRVDQGEDVFVLAQEPIGGQDDLANREEIFMNLKRKPKKKRRLSCCSDFWSR